MQKALSFAQRRKDAKKTLRAFAPLREIFKTANTIYMRTILKLFLFIFFPAMISAQEKTVNPRPMTMEEYEKAKQFTVKDLDNDTYIKIDNA